MKQGLEETLTEEEKKLVKTVKAKNELGDFATLYVAAATTGITALLTGPEDSLEKKALIDLALFTLGNGIPMGAFTWGAYGEAISAYRKLSPAGKEIAGMPVPGKYLAKTFIGLGEAIVKDIGDYKTRFMEEDLKGKSLMLGITLVPAILMAYAFQELFN